MVHVAEVLSADHVEWLSWNIHTMHDQVSHPDLKDWKGDTACMSKIEGFGRRLKTVHLCQ